MRILLVEDEKEAANYLARGLRKHTYAVDVAYEGLEAIEKFAVNTYDIVILDIQLPGKDGLEVCQCARETGVTAPILLLTARGGVSDRILGLDSGADDYLTKPFDFGELLARIRALLRRGSTVTSAVLKLADLELDTRGRQVRRAGRLIELTAKEYALLEFLVRRQGEVLGREEISEHVWEDSYDPFSNLIEVYIQRLRRKLEPPGSQRLLYTRRGEGYILSPEEIPLA